jgi:hypothetical protein
MISATLKRCCHYGNPEFCIQVIVSVLLHHGPEFVLTVLRSAIEHIAAQLVESSPMRVHFKGLSAQLDALLAVSNRLQHDARELN